MNSRSSRIDLWGMGLCAAGLSMLFGCVSHGERNVQGAQPIEGKRVGSPVTDFGLTSSGAEGVSTLNNDVIVRWQTIEGVPIVTALATAWSQRDQERFITSGVTLASIADQFVRTWAPQDAAFVSERRVGVGGTALFAYRSTELRRALGRALASDDGTGDLYVVIVLDSNHEKADVPVVAQHFGGHSDLASAMFTVALTSGQPWRR
jgi:hypothetical protein